MILEQAPWERDAPHLNHGDCRGWEVRPIEEQTGKTRRRSDAKEYAKRPPRRRPLGFGALRHG